jgi:hypothetical protein
MKVLSATIVQGYGCDKVMLCTDLPEAVYPWDNQLAISFDASAGRGAEYVVRHWPDIPVEVIKRDSTTPKFGEPLGPQAR